MEDDSHAFQIDQNPIQHLRRVTNENQKRNLISRDQMKSDQPCLIIADGLECEVIQEIDGESDRFESDKKPQERPNQQIKHQVLIEEETTVQSNAEEKYEKKRDNSPSKSIDQIHIQDEDEVVLFVETKYCTVCHIEQPLRCKHCKSCDHCVATYDHHCPWIGTCVGERNRQSFFKYLVFQTMQTFIGAIIVAELLYDTKKQRNMVGFYLALSTEIIALFFFFMVGSLLIMHTYLIAHNLTTWEFLSWMKITYMKVWPKKYGSPFTRGDLKSNVMFFFKYNFSSGSTLYPWSMPKKLPKLQQ